MTRLQKVLLSVLASGIVLGIFVVGATLWLGRKVGHTFMESVGVAQSRGRREGALIDESACLVAALERIRANPSMSFPDSLRNNQRFVGCLQASRRSPDVCHDVPPMDAPFKVGLWAGQRCNDIGLSGPYCTSLLTRLAEHCSSAKRSQGPSTSPGVPNPGMQRTRYARR